MDSAALAKEMVAIAKQLDHLESVLLAKKRGGGELGAIEWLDSLISRFAKKRRGGELGAIELLESLIPRLQRLDEDDPNAAVTIGPRETPISRRNLSSRHQFLVGVQTLQEGDQTTSVIHAITALKNAVEWDPNKATYHLWLAKAFARNSEKALAIQAVKRALALDPKHQEADLLLSELTRPTDTQGALEDMKLARSYLDDWYKKDATNTVLAFAARYIEQARSKDPDAKLPEKDEDGEVYLSSLNDMAGEVLYCQAISEYHPTAHREQLVRAKDTLIKSLKYRPYSLQCYSKLADVYLDLHDKASALSVARKAAQVFPGNIEARKLNDRVEAAPITHPPTFIDTNPGVLAAVGALALAAGVICIIMSLFGSKTEGLSIFLLVVGAILWFVGRAKESSKLFEQATSDQIRKSKR